MQSIKTASERSTQVDETTLRPAQKTFWPVKEVEGICCSVEGSAKESPLGLKWQELLTHASCHCGSGHLSAGDHKKGLPWRKLLCTKDRQRKRKMLTTRKRLHKTRSCFQRKNGSFLACMEAVDFFNQGLLEE